MVPNEDAEPEIYEEYEKFVAENEIGMDASMQSDYEKFLEDLERKVFVFSKYLESNSISV